MTSVHDDTFDMPGTGASQNVESARRIDPQHLAAAMSTPDADVSMPGRSHAGSVVSNLIALNVGDCYTRSMGIDGDMTAAEVQANFPAWKEKLRQSVNQSIRHAKKFDDRTFTMESVVTTTPSGKIYLQVIVTRAS